MKALLAIAALFLVIGCFPHGDALVVDQEGDFKLELLFERDGCKMYRFYDGGRYVYWSTCQGSTTYSYQSGGKHKTHHTQDTITSKID